MDVWTAVRWAFGAGVLAASGSLVACQEGPGTWGQGSLTSHGPVPVAPLTGPGLVGKVPTDLQPISLPGVRGEPDVRVRLRRGTTSLDLSAGAGGLVRVTALGDPVVGSWAVASPARVRVRPGGWEIVDAAGVPRSLPPCVLKVEPLGAGQAAGGVVDRLGASVLGSPAKPDPAAGKGGARARLSLDGRVYDGDLTLTLTPGGIDAVEQVGIEDYLPGVVSGEVYAHWPAATLQAQAVAARSYALSERARARAAGLSFDLEAGQSDQAYDGAVDVPAARAAVERTRGVVLTWGGQVLRAYYSSTTGGRTAGASETFGGELNAAPPLQSTIIDDCGSGSPWHRWSVTRSADELTQRLRAWGQWAGHRVKTLRSLGSITVAQRNAAGRPVRFTVQALGGVVGAGESYTLSAEQLRVACNFRVQGLPEITGRTLVRSGDVECSIVGDCVVIHGRGFGHGVGMGQWSAKELGERGLDWMSILARFYPGAALARAY